MSSQSSDKSRQHGVALIGSVERPKLHIENECLGTGKAVLPKRDALAVFGSPMVEPLQGLENFSPSRRPVASQAGKPAFKLGQTLSVCESQYHRLVFLAYQLHAGNPPKFRNHGVVPKLDLE